MDGAGDLATHCAHTWLGRETSRQILRRLERNLGSSQKPRSGCVSVQSDSHSRQFLSPEFRDHSRVERDRNLSGCLRGCRLSTSTSELSGPAGAHATKASFSYHGWELSFQQFRRTFPRGLRPWTQIAVSAAGMQTVREPYPRRQSACLHARTLAFPSSGKSKLRPERSRRGSRRSRSA